MTSPGSPSTPRGWRTAGGKELEKLKPIEKRITALAGQVSLRFGCRTLKSVQQPFLLEVLNRHAPRLMVG